MNISNLDILKNSRLAMGLALFVIAIGSGQLISQSDIKVVSVLLPQSAKNYLSAKAEIIGALVLTHISTGDLIPTSAITSSSQVLDQRFVPLTLELTDLPVDLIRGEIVDIYAIPNRDSKTITSPQLVAENISVSAVNERNNSGKVSVLVILKSDLVMPTLAMLADSRFVIVRSI
jgi:flagella basal body P-ring formation protein FlgA